MLQYCKKCKTQKDLTLFPKNSKCLNGVEKQCLSCKSLYRKNHYNNNKVHSQNISKLWEASNKYTIRENKRTYYLRNKDKIIARNTQYQKEKYKDINFKLKVILRSRLNSAIKNNQKSGSAVTDLGCSIKELKAYIESKFQDGMSWDNWSKDGWHIDHVIPLASFDLTNKEEFKRACHYTNLQPLWAKENLKKGSNVI